MLESPNQKSIVNSAIGQFSKLKLLLVLIYLPICLGLMALVVVHLLTDIPLRWFFIDPVAEFNAPMYIGFVSNLGVLLWCSAASACLLGGWLGLKSGNILDREVAWFLICAGLLSAILMLDDLYLLHEEVFEDHLYIPQELVFAAYGGMVVALFWRFRRLLLDTDFLLLILAFVFFVISVGVDVLVEPEEFTIFGGFPGRHIIEDGFKLLGIATWSVYLVRTSALKIAPLIRTN